MKIVAGEIPDVPETHMCEKHGQYESRYSEYIMSGKHMVTHCCPACAQEENEKAEQYHEKQKRAEKLRRLNQAKETAGLKQRHINCTFESFRTDTNQKTVALNLAKQYTEQILAGNGKCLVMAGRVGTGKTHLAAAIINVMIREGLRCQIIKAPELIRKFKGTWGRDSDTSEGQLIDFYSSLALLIIDEIGVQYGTDTEKLLLSEIIDNRYQNMLPTILISNLEVNEIKACIGARSYDRLREDGGKSIVFDWESQRGAVSAA